MRRGPRSLAVTIALAIFGILLRAQPVQSGNAQQSRSFRDGIVLVGFHDGATPDEQKEAISAAQAVELRLIGKGAHVLKVPPGQVMRVVEMLQHLPVVRYAEPDFRQFLSGAPNDPSFPQQWAFHNTGQTVDGVTGTSGADEGTLRAWNVTQGSASAVVAVVDTGIDYSHPDLAANIWSNPGGINGCAAGTHGFNVLTNVCDPMDDDTVYDGHGTHVAGIIGAVGNNGIGVAGVNWKTSLLGVKWVDANGNGFTSDLIAALDWVVQAKQAGVNIRVVNDSQTWAGTAASQALSDEIDVLGSNDMLFVTAAGNTAQDNDTTPRYPCVYDRPNQLCAAASDQNDKLWSSSDFGVQTVDLAAPGVNILSTLRNGAYGFISGCSMSAAQVSGAAALVLSTGYQSVSTLKATLLNAVDPLPAFASTTRTGGRLDLCKAVPGCESAAGVNLVQQAAVQGSGVSSVTANFSASNTAGNLIIAAVRASTTTQTVTVTDQLGNKYTDAVDQMQAADGSQIHIFYAPNVRAGANSVTATLSGTNNHPWIAVFEYSGLSTASPLDRVASAQGTSSSPSSGSTSQTRAANELVFGVLGLPSSSSATVAAGSGFAIEQQDTITGGSRAATEDQIVSTQGAFAASFTLSASLNWSAAVATFSTTPVSNSSPLAVSTTSLPNGTVGTAYSATLGATGGTPPYTWTESGTLPAGLSLSSSGTISGTPTSVGTSNFTVQVQDSASASASAGLSITVSSSTTKPITQVQTASGFGSGLTSLAQAFPSATTQGNMIIAFVRMSTTSQTVSVTDSAGNAYADAVSQAQAADGSQTHIFYATNIKGGANTVTATFSSTNNHPWLAIYEFSGLNATAPLDRVAASQGSSSTPSSGATANTSSAAELVFAGLGLPASSSVTVTGGSGFTLLQQDTAANTSRAAEEDRIVNVIGQYSGTFALSGAANWSVVLATFKQ
jgi:subtilisin family serine protease